MQRLFSMFPRGAPGIALLVLRVAVAAALWTVGPPASSSPVGMTLAFILVGLPLCLGLVTPAAAAVCAALHVFTLVCGDVGQARSAIIAIANASALRKRRSAALGAQENGIHEVMGSIPISSTNSSNDLGTRHGDRDASARHADFDWFEYREREFAADPRD